MARRAIVNHCWEGSSGVGWYPALRRRLEAAGVATVIPDLPDPERPDPAAWLRAFTAAVGRPDEEVVLIGHSLGTANVLRFVERLPEGSRVAGVVLVAGFAEDPDIDAIRSFYAPAFDWARLRARIGRAFAISSDEDPFVRGPDPLRHARAFAARLGATVTILPGGRHFAPSGCADLPEAARRALEVLEP